MQDRKPSAFDYEDAVHRVKQVADTLYFLHHEADEMLQNAIVLLHNDLLKAAEDIEKLFDIAIELTKQTKEADNENQ